MTRLPAATISALVCVAAASPTLAQNRIERRIGDPAVAVGVTAGTTGVGGEVQFALGSIFVLRGAVDTLGFDMDETYDGIAYAGRLADEAREIQSDVEGYGFYPVVQLGLNYKF